MDDKLNLGWNIFTETEKSVYDDQLQYHGQARFYRKKVELNHTFKYWYNSYFENILKHTYTGETLRSNSSKFRQFSFWLESKNLSDYDISNIDNAQIISFFVTLKEKNFSQRTYSGYAYLLEQFFNYLMRKGAIDKNPVYDLPPCRIVKDMGAERIRHCDISVLMNEISIKDPQLALACKFEYYCGMRPGQEIRLLKIKDIDFRNGFAKVRITLENSKTNRRREITIPDSFYPDILFLQDYDKEFYVFSRTGEPGSMILGKNSLRNRFNRIRDRLGFPKEYKLYSFKHTGAVTLAELGEPTINIRDHLGHSSIESTEYYLRRHGFSDLKTIRSNFPKI